MDEFSTVVLSNCRGFQQDNTSGEDICRDFLRNVVSSIKVKCRFKSKFLNYTTFQCTRGSRCKFKHYKTEDDVGKSNPFARSGLVFCHDFQNTVCSRVNCKFVHGSRQDEDYYKVTGELPKHIQEPPQTKLGNPESAGDSEIPVCKDFLKRECQRGKKCKFLHLSETRGTNVNRTEDFDIPEAKRRYLDETPEASYWSYITQHFDHGANFLESTKANSGSFHPLMSNPVVSYNTKPSHLSVVNGSNQYDINMLQEENLLLRKEVEDLKKQVADLVATNEFLLDQNAHYRIQGKYPPSATSLATVSLPAVTIASPVTSTVTAFGALGHLSSVQTVQALATLPLVTAQSTPTINTSIPYATSVSLAQPTPLATVAITPVTINQTTPLAPQNPPFSTASVTLTPTINGAAALQLQGPGSALTFSGAEGSSLVSYPIMTQSLIAPSGLPNSL